MGSITWGPQLAEVYDKTYAAGFEPSVLGPQLRQVPPGQTARVFTLDPDHVGIETFDDPVGQSPPHITGSRWAAAWYATPRPTGTSGRPNST